MVHDDRIWGTPTVLAPECHPILVTGQTHLPGRLSWIDLREIEGKFIGTPRWISPDTIYVCLGARFFTSSFCLEAFLQDFR